MNHLLACMKIIGDDSIQRTQLTHRIALVEEFNIEKGMRVLEIGCGQGDTTVALADAVGQTGKVVAIDIAAPHYGAPITLGEASDTIKQSPLGSRIDFHYETDFLAFNTAEMFDVIVLSHCSWYFARPQQLHSYFMKMKSMTNRVCFAEWDVDYTEISQRSHFCAVNILALYSAFCGGDGNIQNVFHKAQIEEMLGQAGFVIQQSNTIDATYLQDGEWEIDYANELYNQLHQAPIAIQTLATSYYHLMNRDEANRQSLNSFMLIATQ
ncbi:class I SAM-dependent methyltransferase [Solibacillus sp. MA9]|uniref:Class I SAM-dependent methyltransferase n=1 Tax=Solibacillus palustris TaxID=2908203 RepID=A0ABS9UCH8_9BACL|nr:class I SAM-dependent methyltransferase [Solibacillus sp. MA9]MCH7322042.1 class I SAM-dependent methyltransferase [Solibacillus sp. MA9]